VRKIALLKDEPCRWGKENTTKTEVRRYFTKSHTEKEASV